MSLVWVTEDTKHNLAHALPFGEISILERQDYPLFTSGDSVVKRLRASLSNFNPSEDCLLLVGDPILMALAFNIVAERSKFIRVLKWDRQANQYIPVNINL